MDHEEMEELIEALGDAPQASAVFGDPVTQGKITIVPVARARRRLRLDKRAGAALDATPVGCIEIGPKGARFVPIRSAGATGILASLGTTVVLSLGIVAWAWGQPRRRD
jgi:uncharacterized spore protein YtfJ